METDTKVYKRLQFYIVYDATRQDALTSLLSQVNVEKIKYQYKERNDPDVRLLTNDKEQSQYVLSGFLTFQDDRDGSAFKERIFPLIDSGDVVYALVYELENTHHYRNPQPDIILQKIELGDINKIYSSNP